MSHVMWLADLLIGRRRLRRRRASSARAVACPSVREDTQTSGRDPAQECPTSCGPPTCSSDDGGCAAAGHLARGQSPAPAFGKTLRRVVEILLRNVPRHADRRLAHRTTEAAPPPGI